MANWIPYDQPRKASVLSLAPLIDVTFILLIFFMLVTQFSRFSPVDLSVSKTEQIIENTQTTQTGTVKKTQKLLLKNDGTYIFNENPATTLPELATALQNYVQTRGIQPNVADDKKPLIFLETEDKVTIQQLLDVVTEIGRLRSYKVKFIVKTSGEVKSEL